ncbi:LytR/AlgR family response regulator transcription factor [Paucibacter sp. B51]|uniref:LytR/AlgR family response regulator transcription factor n=1 Tax=Paucibacter sp. B51 TaxID=2993315 RepID=UPI0022EBB305|nr:LytTR family DNA-binding domain-containing protein [Paucibacter sp. B51]
MTPTPTALIADDEPVLLEELRCLLQEAWPELQIVASASSGSEARRLLDHWQPDIAFLDIRMPGIDGLSLARLAPPQTRLVFVTAHAEHALEAFEHAAVDYLRKPLTPARLALTVQRLQTRLTQRPQEPDAGTVTGTDTGPRFLQAWIGNSLRLIELEQVAVLRSELRHTRVQSFEGTTLLLRTPLGELQQALDPELFWQVHRGTVVNARAIERVERRENGDLQLHLRAPGAVVPVSRSHRGRFKGM